MLAACLQVRHQSNVHIDCVLASHLKAHLPDGFDEWLALDVSDGTSDLGDDDISGGLFSYIVDEFFYLIRDMGYRLDSGAQITTLALAVYDIGIDLTGRQVREPVEVLIDEPFVMTQIQICLSTVLGDIDLAVLIRAHGSRIHVDIWIEFLGCDRQPARFQKSSDAGCSNTFTKSGNNTACHENVFGHMSSWSIRFHLLHSSTAPLQTGHRHHNPSSFC